MTRWAGNGRRPADDDDLLATGPGEVSVRVDVGPYGAHLMLAALEDDDDPDSALLVVGGWMSRRAALGTAWELVKAALSRGREWRT